LHSRTLYFSAGCCTLSGSAWTFTSRRTHALTAPLSCCLANAALPVRAHELFLHLFFCCAYFTVSGLGPLYDTIHCLTVRHPLPYITAITYSPLPLLCPYHSALLSSHLFLSAGRYRDCLPAVPDLAERYAAIWDIYLCDILLPCRTGRQCQAFITFLYVRFLLRWAIICVPCGYYADGTRSSDAHRLCPYASAMRTWLSCRGCGSITSPDVPCHPFTLAWFVGRDNLPLSTCRDKGSTGL
jgi:hypothetical protein